MKGISVYDGGDCNGKYNITGFITIPNNKFNEINTPMVKYVLLNLLGVTDRELRAIQNKQIRVKELYEKLGSDVTSYNRKSVI